MFSITFRRRNRQADPDRLRIVSNDDQCSDGKPSPRYPLDDELPALFEASFSSISSSSSSDEDDDTMSTSSSRRVSFLLKQEEETGPIQRGSKIKKARSPSMLRRRGKTKSALQHNESIKSFKLLLSGEIPLAKIVLVEDTSETSTTTSPGSRLWMVGTLPEAAPPAILPIDEDLPFDEMAEQKEEQDALGPFDEQASCHCCTRGGATTCVACTQVKVEEQGEGRWKVGNDEQQLCISLPAGTDLDAELPRDLVIEQHSELTMDDVYFCIDDKNIPKWTVESLLLVLFQMVVLKVSSSI